MTVVVEASGDFSNLERFLKRNHKQEVRKVLELLGKRGVNALASATPTASGKTARSWNYKIEDRGDGMVIHWTNSNTNRGVNIAVILQYGHGTGTGGYVAGRDYINPAIRPVFDEIAEQAWRAVTK